ncbi:MAG TPA: hypothetical protein VNG33_04735 [Polyangiaceae bacterium]|nr:hypothetical protein [Polyangiaceae bacterium]
MTPRQRFDIALGALTITLAVGVVSAPAQAAVPQFERVQSKACRALALDQEPYVAALGDVSVTVTDKRGTHEEPLPEALRGASVSVGVFFGRDYRVRIAGTAHTPQGDEVRYYRSLPGGLRPALDELGQLGKRGAPGLVALLGTADPEIVCRPGESCLIKRVSGWRKIAAPAGLSRVGLSLGSGWAIAGTTFFNLDKDWAALGAKGPWREADDAFVRGAEACVVEHDQDRLHHFDGKAWQSSASPVKGPRSLWGDDEVLWVAGDGGAALLGEGDTFQQAGGVGHIAQVLGRPGGDVWLCGDQGVFRARRGSSRAP